MSAFSVDTLKEINKFSTCEIADALLKLGHKPWGGYVADIEMWSPKYCEGNTSIIGPAYTVKMVYISDDTAPLPTEHFADQIPENSIVVISSPPDVKNAVWGGLMSACAKARGAKGVVVDGRIRDLNEHRSMGFPVFAKSHSILPQNAFARPSETQVPLDMASVTVYPGDIIKADVDGVVCIPVDVCKDVVLKCTLYQSIDEKCMKALQQGAGVKETFTLYRGT
ncbi:RraA-like protein [Spinellus fusiger]|nr:RraA-like protein [Spinellus fusiger]